MKRTKGFMQTTDPRAPQPLVHIPLWVAMHLTLT